MKNNYSKFGLILAIFSFCSCGLKHKNHLLSNHELCYLLKVEHNSEFSFCSKTSVSFLNEFALVDSVVITNSKGIEKFDSNNVDISSVKNLDFSCFEKPNFGEQNCLEYSDLMYDKNLNEYVVIINSTKRNYLKLEAPIRVKSLEKFFFEKSSSGKYNISRKHQIPLTRVEVSDRLINH